MPIPDPPVPSCPTPRLVIFLAALIGVTALALNAVSTAVPVLVMDDFQILAKSWTWESTWAHLWVPQNEHIMPLGRFSTWVLISLAGRVSYLPLAASLQGPIALLLGMVLLYLFVSRELGEPLYGLVAMTLFGVTAVYQQAVYWFAASFSILALDMLLLGLLAAQRWRQTGSRSQLAMSALWCALAPGWFASGILAGPFCCVYLLPRERGNQDQVEARGWIKHMVLAGAPLLGTTFFLLLLFGMLRPVVDHIRRLEHYGEKTAEQAIDPRKGAEYTARSVVDNLLPGLVGAWGVDCPRGVVIVLVPVLIAAAAGWTWLAPRRRLCLLGLAQIGLSYWLVYSARAEWQYTGVMNAPHWSRYHLLPQLGLTLFLCAGLAHWSHWFQPTKDGRFTRRQIAAVLLLLTVSFLVQVPRALAGQWGSSSGLEGKRALLDELRDHWDSRRSWVDEQQSVLREIEEMDARCRLHRISRQTAQDALPRREIPLCYERESAWEFLWGSAQPREISVEEARQLLE